MPVQTWFASVGTRQIVMRNEWTWKGTTVAELFVDGEVRDRNTEFLLLSARKPALRTVVSDDDGAVYAVHGFLRSGLIRVIGRIVIVPSIGPGVLEDVEEDLDLPAPPRAVPASSDA